MVKTRKGERKKEMKRERKRGKEEGMEKGKEKRGNEKREGGGGGGGKVSLRPSLSSLSLPLLLFALKSPKKYYSKIIFILFRKGGGEEKGEGGGGGQEEGYPREARRRTHLGPPHVPFLLCFTFLSLGIMKGKSAYMKKNREGGKHKEVEERTKRGGTGSLLSPSPLFFLVLKRERTSVSQCKSGDQINRNINNDFVNYQNNCIPLSMPHRLLAAPALVTVSAALDAAI